jgi:hypothetical protein
MRSASLLFGKRTSAWRRRQRLFFPSAAQTLGADREQVGRYQRPAPGSADDVLDGGLDLDVG